MRLLKIALLNERGIEYEIVEVTFITLSRFELITVEYKIVQYEEC